MEKKICCSVTNLFLDLSKEINDTEIVARVRYDFDDVTRNEFDIQIVEYIKDGKYWENTDNNDWTHSFVTNFCPVCGREFSNKNETGYFDEKSKPNPFKSMIIRDYIWKLAYDNKLHNIRVILGLNVLTNEIELRLYIDNRLMETAKRKVNYDPVSGNKL